MIYYNIIQMESELGNLQKDNENLQKDNENLQKELKLYQSLFKYPLINSCIFNLTLVSRNGEKEWIDRIKVTKGFLLQCEQTDTVKELLENINPRYER
jgi:hypothetical protein